MTPKYFPFYPHDFFTATAAWPVEHVGAYLLLLLYQWNRGTVPTEDVAALARIMRMPVTRTRMVWSGELGTKFPGGKNRRLEQVRVDVNAAINGRRARAQKGAEARWQHDASSKAQALLKQSLRDANTKYKEESTKAPPVGVAPNPDASASGSSSIPRVRARTLNEIERAVKRRDRRAVQNLPSCPHDPACTGEARCVERLVRDAQKKRKKTAGEGKRR